jgi:recombination protein RecA
MTNIFNLLGDGPRDFDRWWESFKGLALTRDKPRITHTTILTGLPSVDRALIDGWLHGRIVEVFGPQAVGKTTLMYYVIAAVQRLGGVCAFVDFGQFDPDYARQFGVNVDELIVSQVNTDKEALSLAKMLADSGMVDALFVDSLTTVTPDDSLEERPGCRRRQEEMMQQAMRELAESTQQMRTLCLMTNSLSEGESLWGDHPALQALRSFSSQRLEMWPRGGYGLIRRALTVS